MKYKLTESKQFGGRTLWRIQATAPDACWECVHFTDCSCSDARNCEKWRNEE